MLFMMQTNKLNLSDINSVTISSQRFHHEKDFKKVSLKLSVVKTLNVELICAVSVSAASGLVFCIVTHSQRCLTELQGL